jgi:hypothetical protein
MRLLSAPERFFARKIGVKMYPYLSKKHPKTQRFVLLWWYAEAGA